MSNEDSFLQDKLVALEQALKEEKTQVLLLKKALLVANKSIQKSTAKMQSDLFLLQTMQKVLIPDEWDYLSGFKISAKYNSGELGGDYYDIFGSKASKIFNVWMSHSSSLSLSALLSAIVLQLSAAQGIEVKLFLSQLYEEITRVLEEQHFFDFFYASLERNTLQLSFVAQGNMLCFHCREGELTSLVRCKDPVSLFTAISDIQTIKLLPKDRLVFCTPGITLEKNNKKEVFGSQRIIDIIHKNLDTHALRNEIFSSIKNFTNTNEFRHDHSVIVLDVKAKALRLV
ncbi:MAG: SpoIIE family protein phosphatase [Bdellovibrionaceae bacterium]|nr:SpoIIE family protein phosphatase [Pseudobdellovibrionaceae bacterium]